MKIMSFCSLCLVALVTIACGSEEADQRIKDPVNVGNELSETLEEEQDAEEDIEEEDTQETQTNDGPPLGFEDAVAATACTQFTGAAIPIVAAESEEEAAQALIQTSSNAAYTVQLLENGPAYLTIEIADWMASVRFFAELGTSYEIINGQVATERSLNDSCPDKELTDQRWMFHGWGSYTVRIDSSDNNPAWFMAIME